MKQMNVFLFLLLQAGFSVRKKICAKSEAADLSPLAALALGERVGGAKNAPSLPPAFSWRGQWHCPREAVGLSTITLQVF